MGHRTFAMVFKKDAFSQVRFVMLACLTGKHPKHMTEGDHPECVRFSVKDRWVSPLPNTPETWLHYCSPIAIAATES